MESTTQPPTYDQALTSKDEINLTSVPQQNEYASQPQNLSASQQQIPNTGQAAVQPNAPVFVQTYNPSGFEQNLSASQQQIPNTGQAAVQPNPPVFVQTYNPSGFDNIVYKPQTPNDERPRQSGPVSRNNDSGETGGFTVRGSFGDMAVRRVFIRKVFFTLGLQLLLTFGFVCLFYFVYDLKFFVQRNAGVYYAAYGVFLVMYIVLVCSRTASRKYPWNIVMLILLTLAMSYMVGTITSYYDIQAVLVGVGVTVVVCVAVMLFSLQTRFDFTKCGGLLFILCMVLFFFGFITIFTYSYNWYVQVVYGCLGALVFTLFLAFDTQLVMGGRKYELDPEEHVFASLILYIDIIYIFLFLLSIFGGSSR